MTETSEGCSETTKKRHAHARSDGYTDVCGVSSSAKANPVKKSNPGKGDFYCPRCGSNSTKHKPVKDHLPDCIAKCGNPNAIRYTYRYIRDISSICLGPWLFATNHPAVFHENPFCLYIYTSNDPNEFSLIGTPQSYEITHLAASQNIASASVRYVFIMLYTEADTNNVLNIDLNSTLRRLTSLYPSKSQPGTSTTVTEKS